MSKQSDGSKFDPANLSMKGLETYFNSEFLNDIKKLKFQKPNKGILSNPASFGIDEQTVFFGGKSRFVSRNTKIWIGTKSSFTLFRVPVFFKTNF